MITSLLGVWVVVAVVLYCTLVWPGMGAMEPGPALCVATFWPVLFCGVLLVAFAAGCENLYRRIKGKR